VPVSKLLGRGGEGSVYEITNEPNIAAKIYFPDKALARKEKILAMVQARLHVGAASVTYPMGPLYHSNGNFAGFTMQKVGQRRPVHELYSPSSRRQQFKKGNFPFLVRAALNVAASMSAVHESGCVIGDVNHSGILISQDAVASLIDADSFQFQFQGRTYRCAVGVADFTPPELQGGRLDRVDRTMNHDAFGLAVMVFQLLFMGRHPFVGGFLPGGDMPMEKAIAECRFAYSSDRSRTRMEAPPHVPTLEDLPSDLARAFEVAFSPKSMNAGRPTADDWCRVIQDAETRILRCKSSPSHDYFREAANCPWCRMERGFPGFVAFTANVQINQTTPAHLSQLIAAIRAVPDPGVAPPLVTSMPAVQIVPKPQTKGDSGAGGFIVATIGAIACIPLATTQVAHPLLALAGFGGCAYAALRTSVGSSGQLQSEILRKGFQRHEEHYRSISDNRRFTDARQKTEAEIRDLGNLGNVEARLIAELSNKLRELQLRNFLEKYHIAGAKIKGLGNTRKATLRSYGIETAADVEKYAIERISGFGPATSALLVAWRQFHERKFVFNPNQPINPSDIARVKSQVAQQRLRLEQVLRTRLTELRQISAEIQQGRSTTIGHAASVWRDLKQAEADEGSTPSLRNPKYRRLLFGSLSVLTLLVCSNYGGPRSTTTPTRPSVSTGPVAAPTAQSLPSRAPASTTVTAPTPEPAPPSASSFPAPVPQAPLDLGPSKPPASASAVAKTPEPGYNSMPVQQPQLPQKSDVSGSPASEPSMPVNPTQSDVVAPPPPPQQVERGDPAFVAQRLSELGYLSANTSPNSPAFRRGMRDFKVVNGFGPTEEIDQASIRSLNSGAPLHKNQTFIGGWSPLEACPQGIQLEVTTSQAKTDGGTCRFNRVTSSGSGWRIQARCQVDAEAWPANISFSVTGKQLEWRSEKGRQIYYRCQ
jgi:DNA-binding helix-hairpin-helix protein with protein kinase domain